jgi:hypothetical protein
VTAAFGHTIRCMGARPLPAVAALFLAASLAATAAASTGARPKAKPKPAPSNSAAAQYGRKVQLCAVTLTGKQHTIELSSKAVAAFIAAHPRTHTGACIRPRGAKLDVCVKLTKTKYAAVYVPPRQLKAYLKRNHGSYRTTTGKCTRRKA